MLVEKLMGVKTVYVDVEQLAEVIDRYFIQGANEQQLQEVRKIVKGNFFLAGTYERGDYKMMVSHYLIRYWPLHCRFVWIYDKNSDVYYELKKRRWFKKLRKAVYERLDRAKAGAGMQVKRIFCTNCGKENTADSKFCEGCGAELYDASENV